jgi:hypothetical protein
MQVERTTTASAAQRHRQASSCRTVVDDALAKGIPMFFVAEAGDLPRPLVLVRQARGLRARHMRLSYQPLTRRWRLQVSSSPSAIPGWCWARCSTPRGGAGARCSASRAGASPTWRPRPGRHVQHRLPLPAGRVAAAAAVPDRRRRPERLEHQRARARSAWRWRAPGEPARRPEGPPRKLVQGSRACAGRWRWPRTVMVAIGIVLMFLLTQATNNRELYERNYGRLFALNMVVAGVLLAGDPLGRGAAGLAPAARQVRQPPAGEAGDDLRAGGLGARAC